MDIKKFLDVALSVAALVPSPAQPFVQLAIPFVQAAETIFGASKGVDKKSYVLDKTADAINIYNTQRGLNINTSELMTAISNFVDSAIALEKVVAKLNAQFNKD